MTEEKKTGLTPGGKLKVGPGAGAAPKSLMQRIKEQQEQAPLDFKPGGRMVSIAESEPVAILMDDSSSMNENAGGGTKYDLMNQAIGSFADDVNFGITPIKTSRFNMPELRPSQSAVDLKYAARLARPSGGTPMHRSMEAVDVSDTKRAIIISDGEVNRKDVCLEFARTFAEKDKVADCIHIGNDKGGEETMKEIAEITHGIFFKFTDVASFAKSFKLLSPKGRKQLESKSASELKRLTGATEVIK